MQFLLLAIFLTAFSVEAKDEALSFKNDREGKTYYSGTFQKRALKRALKKASKAEIIEVFQEALKKQNPQKLCSFDLNEEIKKELQGRALDVALKGFIHALRAENEIDDVVAKILLRAEKVSKTNILEREDDPYAVNLIRRKEIDAKMNLIMAFEKRSSTNACLDEKFRAYYNDLIKLDNKMNSNEVGLLHYEAFLENKITKELYTTLEQARLNELEAVTLTLAGYRQKIKMLRAQYPLHDVNEKSDFTNKKVKKSDSSLRQHLFENYNEMQIIIMGNVIKKLRARLEYDAVYITSHKDGVAVETIPLDPMERFRFAIKVLRKEMAMLALNNYFQGRTPTYMDLMISSYEIGVIRSSELDVVASLEEVWNPKKTFWEKSGIWIKAFASIATATIPPPFGFIPALVIVAIEASNAKVAPDNSTELF